MKTNIYIRLMIFSLSIVIVFHLSLIFKIIPYNITWGGRLKNDTEMYTFETISILINLFMITIFLIKGKYLKLRINEKIINFILWVFLLIFSLNTIGNLVAKTSFEKTFSILTFIFVILIWKILRKNEEKTL